MQNELEAFIYLEANLMDECKYEQWLELFAEDCIYWIPSWATESEIVSNPANEISLIYWDKKNLREYVYRLRSGDAHAMIPQPRTARYVTNVFVQNAEEEDAFIVKSNWFLHDYRLEHNAAVQQFFGGRMVHRIVKQEGAFKITEKKVIVINDDIKRGHLMII